MSTYNKAVINGTTYIDLSSDTVSATNMLSGITAHDKNGASITGSIADMTLGNATTTNPTSATNVQTIGRSTSTRYISVPVGYNSAAKKYTISAVANGSATTPATTITVNPTITASSGNITASYSGSKSITPTVSAGYVSSGTAGTVSTSGTTTVAATSLDSNLTAENIASGIEIFGVTGTMAAGPTCTTKSGGVTWATCCTFPSNGVGWREEKYSDGRLIRWVWDWFTMSSAGRSASISTSGATAFTTTPIFTVGFRDSGNHACKGSVSAWSNTSVTVYMYENSYGGYSAVCIRMEGYWK